MYLKLKCLALCPTFRPGGPTINKDQQLLTKSLALRLQEPSLLKRPNSEAWFLGLVPG